MKTALKRRLRGILGIGRWWAIGWALLGPALVVLIQSVVRASSGTADQVVAWLLVGGIQFALYGFLAGSLFGSIVAFAERRSEVKDLRVFRFAMWGLLAGIGMPAANILGVRWIEGIWLGEATLFIWVGGILGVVSAVATLKIAHLAITPAASANETLEHAGKPALVGPTPEVFRISQESRTDSTTDRTRQR